MLLFRSFALVLPLLTLLLMVPPAASEAAPLDGRIERLTSEGAARRAIWGVYAVDAKSGEVIADVNGTRCLVPASNRKLVSTALVSTAYKADETVATEFRAPALSGGRAPSVTLHAAGDPSWYPEFLRGRSGTTVFTELARAAKEKGLNAIEGDVQIDVSLFTNPDPLPPGWVWDNFVETYSSRPAALSFNQNLVGISLKPTAVGSPVQASFPIAVEPFRIVNESVTLGGGAAPTLSVDRALDGSMVTLRGGLPLGTPPSSRAIPLGNAVEVSGALLMEALKKQGITVGGKLVVGRFPERGSVELATMQGAPIADLLRVCNEESDNFLAESLYLLAAARLSGRASYASAHAVEENFWKKIKVDPAEVNAADGSGLSRENFVTPRALVELLRAREGDAMFKASLPVSGRTGTLRYRLGEGLAGRVRAKTGTLDGVAALSGYLTANSGRTIYFSIMANNFASGPGPIRARIDDIVEVLAGR